MRQLNPATNLLLAVLAGIGVLGSLTLPWFSAPASSSVDTDGPVERAAWQVAQTFRTGAEGMIDGSDAIGGAQGALLAVVAVVGMLGLMISLDVGRQGAESVLRAVAIATPVIVIAVAAAHPGTEQAVRVHYGFLVAVAAALFTANAAWHGASWRRRYAPPVRGGRAFTR